VHFVFLRLGHFDQRGDVLVEFEQAALTARLFGQAERLPIILARHIGRSATGSPIGGPQIHLPLQILIRTFHLLVLRLIKLRLSLTFFDLLLKVLDRCLSRIFVIFLVDHARLDIGRIVLCFGVLHVLVGAHLLSLEAIRIIGGRIINFNASCCRDILRNSRRLLNGRRR
jgi:hypothetical protein